MPRGKKTNVPFDRSGLRRMAGARSFERGEVYFHAGQVGPLAEDGGRVAATVHGTRSYTVCLRIDLGTLEYSCSCPVGEDGAFCKHAVALGLAWIDGRAGGSAPRTRAGKAIVTMEDVRAWLTVRNKSVLIDMLVDRAMEDDRFRQQLLLKAAKKTPQGVDLDAYRAAIDQATDTGGFVHYRDASAFTDGIHEVIEAIDEVLAAGYAEETIVLTEHALVHVEDAIGSMDDSDGNMSIILERLQDIHLKACRNAKPDPETLARGLFGWELQTEWDTFVGAAQTYAGILGKRGLAVYRELAEKDWAKVPVQGPGANTGARYGKHYRITRIMESLARQSGDVESVVAVKSRQLSTAYDFLQIAETYKQAGKHDKALEWAERGVEAFPAHTDTRLRAFLAADYHRLKRHDEAMVLIWADFAERPFLENFKNLRAHADRIDQWESWRKQALDHLRRTIAGQKTKQESAPVWGPRMDHSELVRIFLWEKDIGAAWREAEQGGCAEDLWLELAAKRESKRPEDALPIYQRQIEPVLARKNNQAYAEAVEFLKKIHRLMAQLNRLDAFHRYLDTVRSKHKPKRNFMKLLDRAKWG